MKNTEHVEYDAWVYMKSSSKRKNGNLNEICPEWRNSFEYFFDDMGKKPDESYRLARLDNSKPYSKQNCAWVSQSESSFLGYLNRKKSHNIIALQKRAFEIISNSRHDELVEIKKQLLEILKNETHKKILAKKSKG